MSRRGHSCLLWFGDIQGWRMERVFRNQAQTSRGLQHSSPRNSFYPRVQEWESQESDVDAMNRGDIRIIFGSTSMLGTGTNAQQRAVAIHHLDTPWRPSDLEQRNGRAVRKGNLIAKEFADNKVDVIIYAVERSLDSYKFNLLHNKQLFINQLKSKHPWRKNHWWRFGWMKTAVWIFPNT